MLKSSLTGFQSGRRPKTRDDVLDITSNATQVAIRRSSSSRRICREKSNVKLQKLSSYLSEAILVKLLSNQEESVRHLSQKNVTAQIEFQSSKHTSNYILEQINTNASKFTLEDVPLHLLQGVCVDLRRWSVIVSDQTLRRLAAHNTRITKIKQKDASIVGQSQQRFPLGEEAVQNLSLSCLNVEDQPTEILLLSGSDAITDVGLAVIAAAVPKLKHLDIGGAGRVTDTSLRLLGEYCPNLERLNLSDLYRVRGAGLAALVDRCGASLSHLSLAGCWHLEHWVLCRCFYAAPRLTHLDLSYCSQVGDEIIKTLARQCPLLRKLELSGCLKISDQGVVWIAQSCRQLEYIALDRPIGVRGVKHFTDLSCSALGLCRRLGVILLAGCRALTDVGVQSMISRCTQLTRLDLTGVIGLTDATCAAVGTACRELRSLRINGVKGISNVGLRHLSAGCTKLELLHVANLYLVSDGSNRDFGLEGLRAIASKCIMLRDLNLSGCFQLQERALVAIGMGCPALHRLSLQGCLNITLVAVLAVLKGCQQLARLDLSAVLQCDDRMLRAIAKYGSAIVQLVVVGCKRVGDAGLRDLAASRADQLELLDLTGCCLLSDAGLNALCDAFQRPKLAHLVLAKCPFITEESIARLACVCPKLLTISVHGCRVSARALQSLSSSWPFGVLQIPPSGSLTESTINMGIFPAQRAKDRRYIAEFGALWTAASTIQNLFRTRVARRELFERRQVVLQHAVARKLQSIWRGRQARRYALVLRMNVLHYAKIIQQHFRASRQLRFKQSEAHNLTQRQVEAAAVLVQRQYRAMRAGRDARCLVAGCRRDLAYKTQAVLKLQRIFRRRQCRKKLRLLHIQKLVQSRKEHSASVQIQRRYRGHKARQLVLSLRKAQQCFLGLQYRCAVRIQTRFRCAQALRTAERRRNVLLKREVAIIKLQSVFRAQRGRQAAGLLALAKQHQKQKQAVHLLQCHWRKGQTRFAGIIAAESRRILNQQQSEAAVVIQRITKKYLVRRRACSTVLELLMMQQRAIEMKQWASTLVQANWRRHQAYCRTRMERITQRTRWKQLLDSNNEHGAGIGAPFYFNQVNGTIRWRLPRDLLALTTRPTCAQCDIPESASFECATCSEFFCKHCDRVVHGGKRRRHNQRELFDYYGRRRDYGDGTFPSIWPSEIFQDASRGYDFVRFAPRDNYQEMVEEILNFVPVSTGSWDDDIASPIAAFSPTPTCTFMNGSTSKENEGQQQTVYRDDDFDEQGASLWEIFYDYAQEKYRYYHRISKRVVSRLPEQKGQLALKISD
ncbi:putative IQ motif, EF-hand binding, B-box-type zinc finger, leucine-rich repeat domain superfamily [Plasmopara halstedii]